jgi:hypothetical protein
MQNAFSKAISTQKIMPTFKSVKQMKLAAEKENSKGIWFSKAKKIHDFYNTSMN